MIDRLLVLDDADTRAKGDGWSPLEIDQGVAGSSLADWIMLPWGAPDQVLVPGFHSAAENSLKGAALDLAGDDIFQTVCRFVGLRHAHCASEPMAHPAASRPSI